jgi:hypothetical protein
MAEHGLETVHWNLLKDEPPFNAKFDFVFFVEVIEHLPNTRLHRTETCPEGYAIWRSHHLHHAQSLPPPERSIYGAWAAHF